MLFANCKGVLVLLWAGMWIMACQPVKQDKKNTFLPSSDQLVYRAKIYNEFLRWRAYDRAKFLVAPHLRSAFEMKWEREKEIVHIIGFDVRDVTLQKGGKEALIVVIQDGYRSTSSALKKKIFQQRWIVHDGDWFFVEDAKDIKPPTSRATQPVIPRASYMTPRTIP